MWKSRSSASPLWNYGSLTTPRLQSERTEWPRAPLTSERRRREYGRDFTILGSGWESDGQNVRRRDRFITAKNAYTLSEESGEEVVSGRKSVIRLGRVAFVGVCKVGYCSTLRRPKPAGSVGGEDVERL